MSRDTLVAKRYARALFEVTFAEGKVAETQAELRAITEAFASEPALRKFVSSPGVSVEDKKKVLSSAFEGRVSVPVIRTVELLLERGRTQLFGELRESYEQISNEALGLADATVYTAFPMTEAEKAETAQRFGVLTGKKITVHNVVDKTVLGGAKVVIGNTLYDGSLAGKLERLEKSFERQA
ncbi:F0F1 ATP synthase subunit delta [Saccharibacillus sp. CPCC 101409]|uniref:F0F1 ATP synthase subunit delta n=1 Tax=Saccharibacillus sp. CPCC 101409 TaxID=3058041 RepID=UPI002670EA93|nr:F0F1 ATP synthase subunit delta [Saccharibacillus sp. CPCC 101409]MDO3412115.1 F0F1 ATP synthase subunit delta [Saccharibacillus sp. CPCC 101409]